MAEDKKDDAVKQKAIQQKFMEYQVAEQQMQQMQQQMEKLENQTNEIRAVEQSIEDIGKAKAGDEVLVPVSGGIFFRTTMKENQQFLVNVGSNVVVEKDIEGTKSLIRQQAEEIEKYKAALEKQMAEMMEGYQKLEAELKKIIED